MERKVLYDGVCKLCGGFVSFVAERAEGGFEFVPLQSDEAEELLDDTDLDPEKVDSIVLIQSGEAYTESEAALRILRHTGFTWSLVSRLLLPLPSVLTDALYRLVANNRYSVFGKKDRCMMPGEL